MASYEYDLSLSKVEKLHARSRQTANPYMTYPSFASSFINKQLVEASSIRDDERQLLRKSPERLVDEPREHAMFYSETHHII